MYVQLQLFGYIEGVVIFMLCSCRNVFVVVYTGVVVICIFVVIVSVGSDGMKHS